jgi:hypothetical protein
VLLLAVTSRLETAARRPIVLGRMQAAEMTTNGIQHGRRVSEEEGHHCALLAAKKRQKTSRLLSASARRLHENSMAIDHLRIL